MILVEVPRVTEVVGCGVVGDGVVWRGGKDGLGRGGVTAAVY